MVQIAPAPHGAFIAYPTMGKSNFPVNNQFGFRLPQQLAREFREKVSEDKMSPIFVELVRKWLNGDNEARAAAIAASDLEGAPLLDVRVACGPPEEAREDASLFVVSKQVGDEMGLDTDSDFFARTRGESMEGAGILDEFVVCFSPLASGRFPRVGQIALVACEDGEGAVTGTVKRWNGQDGNTPRLQNGKGEDSPLPDGTVKAWPVAIAKGVVGGL